MLIFIDVETTGLEKKDRICAVGLIAVDGDAVSCLDDLVKPPRKIRPDAMAVHHITNEMVAACPPYEQCRTAAWLAEHNGADAIMVGHNVGFDLEMLQREGFVWQGRFIDTLKCARHLIAELDHYGLQYLRYELGLYKTEAKEAAALGVAIKPHEPLSDALHVRQLYAYLRELADDTRLCELSLTPVLVQKFDFGKYKGRHIEEIVHSDPGYLHWMLDNMFDMDEDLRYSVTYYLKEVR